MFTEEWKSFDKTGWRAPPPLPSAQIDSAINHVGV